MKMPITWHEECLKNNKNHLLRKEAEAERVMESLKRHRMRVEHLEFQIQQARRKGKTGFDSERFLPMP